MRVLIDYRPALRERSGVGEYAHELAVALVHADVAARPDVTPFQLTLFSSSWKDRMASMPELAAARIVDRHVPVRVLNFAWHRLQWPPVESFVEGSLDVVQSLHPLLMPTRRAAQVVTIHDLNFLTHPERTRAEVRRDYPALARAHAHQADRVIVVSHFTAGEVERRLGVAKDRISVCPPGAPPWTARPAAPQDGYVLFFGTLEPRKNVGALLDAYEALLTRGKAVPPLVLAGKATGQSGPWLERITRVPLSGHVRHIGYVEPSQRRALYEGARMLVQPSFEEGFGLPVLEAMTLGVPVIAARRGALPEVLGEAGALVEPEDIEALAEAIQQLVADPDAAATAAAKGIARARAFSWKQTAEKTIDAYQAAVAHRTAERGAA